MAEPQLTAPLRHAMFGSRPHLTLCGKHFSDVGWNAEYDPEKVTCPQCRQELEPNPTASPEAMALHAAGYMVERLRQEGRQGRILIALLLGRLGDRAEFSAAELVAAEEAALVTTNRPETGGLLLYVSRDRSAPPPAAAPAEAGGGALAGGGEGGGCDG